jgi:hypothetical protein
MTIEVSRQIFEKYSDIKFHGNPSKGSRVFPYGKKGADRFDEGNGPFRSVADAPKTAL